MTLEEIFRDLHAKHFEATQKNDLPVIADVSRRYDELLNDAPEDIALIFAAGTTKMQLGLNGLAIALFEKALRIRELPEIWNNLGTAHKGDNRNEIARECWLRALALREDADYYNNMATLYINEGKPAEGLEWVEKGLKLNPSHARLRWNHGLLLLESGRWAEGFDEYEWGIESMDRPLRNYSNPPEKIPFWNGQKRKTVVVYGEQGIGDEIMYASCIPDLAKDVRVIFDCHPRMVRLMERSFGVKCYGTRKDNILEWPKQERIDYKVAIGSLFKWYRRDGNFPKVPYLKPDPALVAHYRARMEALGPGPYVGIAWKAGTKQTNAGMRSLKLSAFNPIVDQGGTFISLQYTSDAGEKVARHKELTGRVIHHWADSLETGPDQDTRFTGFDYDHTVAIVAALDLVIVPNTAVVHVAGAIGKECWTMTPDACAWRYQLTGDEMPMYKSVRQFRGEKAIERIAEEYRNRWSRPEFARTA